jgi:periplasmic divalent cation tolerance protein
MEINLVYMTTSDKEEARKIGKVLVESRLAACVNIIDPMISMYRWEGKICDDQETVMIAKTTEENISALKEKVISLHSYECPCIVCLPVKNGHEPFLAWVQEHVRNERS